MFSQLFVGFLLIICGFLVKKHPNLIAGYNTMSQKDKEKININALSTFLKQLLIGLGVFTISIYFFLKIININENIIVTTNTLVITIGVILGLIYANLNKKFKR